MIEQDKILWCPVALPKFPKEEFLSCVDHLVKQQEKWKDIWHAANISREYLSTIRQENNVIDEWFDTLPVKSILKIKLNVQINPVVEHVDIDPVQWNEENPELLNHWLRNEPAGYRVLISGTRKNKLYVTVDNKKIYTEIPSDTDTYLMNSSVYHGVDDDVDRKLLYMNLEIDEEKHKKLVETSYNKYKKFIVEK